MFDWINSMYLYMTSTDLKIVSRRQFSVNGKFLLYNMLKFQLVCMVFSNQNNKYIKIVHGYTETKAGSIPSDKYAM